MLMRLKRTIRLFLLIAGFWAIAPVSANEGSVGELVQERIEDLMSHIQQLKKEKVALSQLKAMAQKKLIDNWDVQGSLVSLVGKSRWGLLSADKQKQLIQEFQSTLTRYFIEVYSHFDDQRVYYDKLKLNKNYNKGWAKVIVSADYLPDFAIDIKIVNKNKQWMYQDIRVHGVSYLKMKRSYYSNTLDKQGADHLIAELRKKNVSFFGSYR